MRLQSGIAIFASFVLVGACGSPSPVTPTGTPRPTLGPTAPSLPGRVVHADGHRPVVVGEPIVLGDLSGRIVTDDFEDVFAMDVDGSNFVRIAYNPGAEFDASWSPDGKYVVYRDSTRGINQDDEIFIASADGNGHRNLTNDSGQ